MVNERNAFESKLNDLAESCIEGNTDVTQTLSDISDLVYRFFGINVWFVEILGRRWSYIAGRTSPSFAPPEHVMLNNQYGLVADAWNDIPEQERNTLVDWTRYILTDIPEQDGSIKN